MAGAGGDEVAARCHARRGRSVRLPPGRAQRERSGRPPISRHAREPDDYAVTFSVDRATFRRRDERALHAARHRGLDGRRRRSAAGDRPEPRGARARARRDQLRRDRPQLPGERHRASGIREAVHRDGVSPGQRGAAVPSSATRSAGADRVGVPCAQSARPGAGPGRMGNRSRPVPRSRAQHLRSRGPRRAFALGHDGCRARSDRQPSPADQVARRRRPCGCASRPAWRRIARRPKRWRRSITSRAPRRGPSRWRSRTRRVPVVIWGSPPTRRCSSNVWRRACSAPMDRFARARRSSPPTSSASLGCGRTAFPAIFRSSSCASPATGDPARATGACRRRNTGG